MVARLLMFLGILCSTSQQRIDMDEAYMLEGIQEPIFDRIPEQEERRLRVGSDVILECRTNECGRSSLMNWTFIPTKSNKNNEMIEEHIKRRKCSVNLNITNISASHSGIYKCFLGNNVIASYLLEIIEAPGLNGDPPEVIEVEPNHSTLSPTANLTIKCKVMSKRLVPVILWFKKVERGTTYDVLYNGTSYKRIGEVNQVYPVPNVEHVFVSKLQLRNASQLDSGTYVCVAMTAVGKDLVSFTVDVLPNNLSHTTLLLLFLIPVPFILIPAVVWLCYYKSRKTRLKPGKNKTELAPINHKENV